MRTPIRLFAMPSRTLFLGSCLREEVLERLGERVRIAKLSADDDARARAARGRAGAARRAVVRDARGGELRRADLQADEAPLGVAALGLHLRSLRLRSFGCFGSWAPSSSARARPSPSGSSACLLDRLVAVLAAEREVLLPERDLRGLLSTSGGRSAAATGGGLTSGRSFLVRASTDVELVATESAERIFQRASKAQRAAMDVLRLACLRSLHACRLLAAERELFLPERHLRAPRRPVAAVAAATGGSRLGGHRGGNAGGQSSATGAGGMTGGASHGSAAASIPTLATATGDRLLGDGLCLATGSAGATGSLGAQQLVGRRRDVRRRRLLGDRLGSRRAAERDFLRPDVSSGPAGRGRRAALAAAGDLVRLARARPARTRCGQRGACGEETSFFQTVSSAT